MTCQDLTPQVSSDEEITPTIFSLPPTSVKTGPPESPVQVLPTPLPEPVTVK